MTKVELTLNKRKKEVSFNVPNDIFVPRYLKYLLEFHKIPDTYKIIFTDKTFNNIEHFIKEGDRHYELK